MSERDSFIFYRSFFLATKPLKKNEKAELFDAICNYALDQKEINLKPMAKAMFSLIRPQLQANYTKFLNGKKPKQDRSEPQANDKQNESKSEGNVNDNVNDNVNVINVNDNVNNNDVLVYSKEVHDCYLNCIKFFEDHLKPSNEKNKKNWLDTIDKLNRLDRLPFAHIERIVRGARTDDFWRKNFLSLPKLRKKNNEGILYVIVFNEKLKTIKNGNSKITGASLADANRRFKGGSTN